MAKKVPQTGNKDKEHGNERITEIEQTDKDLNKARKVYFDLIKMQKMAQMKHSVTKRVVREGKRPPQDESGSGKVPRKEPKVQMERRERRKQKFRLGTKALREICKFQKSTELLMPKIAFYRLTKEILQKE